MSCDDCTSLQRPVSRGELIEIVSAMQQAFVAQASVNIKDGNYDRLVFLDAVEALSTRMIDLHRQWTSEADPPVDEP